MARRSRKSRPQPTAVAETAGAGESAEAWPAGSRWRLILAIGVAFAWIAGLALLASVTANRPMLNRAQILQADLIVTGRVIDREQGTVSIEKIWNRPADANRSGENDRIAVRNLSESKAENESTWLLPLTQVAGDVFEITRPRLARPQLTEAELERPPRIYPASDKAIERLQAILKVRPGD